MARPKKSVLPETVTPEVEALTEQIKEVITEVPKVEETPVPSSPVPIPEPPVEVIQPEADRYEMDRYIRVINNSEQASRIMDAISHQRDLEMWGVHQYDKNRSRNSYARSFYFKDRLNAVKALDHANKLLG